MTMTTNETRSERSKAPKFLAGAVVLMVLGAGLLFQLDYFSPAATRADRALLRDEGTPPAVFFSAMDRLGRQHDSFALRRAHELAASPRSSLREAAAHGLGFYPGADSDQPLKTLTNDADAAVRRRAIESLATLPSPARSALLAKIGSDPKRSEMERTLACGGGLSTGSEEATQCLLELARDAKAGSMAASQLMLKAPNHPQVQALMMELVAGGVNPDAVANVIQFQAVSRPAWLSRQAARLAASPARQVRLAVVRTIHLLCPPDRWKILNDVLSREKDEEILGAIVSAPRFLAGPDADRFLDRLAGDANLKPALRAQATSIAHEPTKGRIDHCDNLK